MSICGLDFGTSNTTLGTIDGAVPVLAALEAAQTTIPSAIFYEADGGVRIGRKAVEAYVEGVPGRFTAEASRWIWMNIPPARTMRARTRVPEPPVALRGAP